jgi:superfamily II DNA or RNA helicase
LFGGTLREATSQPQAFAAGVAAFAEKGGGVLSLPCGFGKCLGKDTPVIMFDGAIKKVQDIQVNELIMGDDSTPRTVLSTCTGTEQLYKIVPTKGDPYIVNESHILSLKYCQKRNRKWGQILDMPVTDYLNSSSGFKHNEVRGYRVPISFSSKEVPLDPYMLGYWLGDGVSRSAVISSQDSTVLHYFHRNLGKYGLHLDHILNYDYRIKGSKPNYFYKTLKELDLIGNKHIPHVYKCNSRDVQLQVLAGLIDSDGSFITGGWEFVQKNEKLFDDVLFLCRSLGFACYKNKCTKTCTNAPGGPKAGTYYRCSITGAGLEEVPCKVPRKKHFEPRTQIKDVLNVGITVEKLAVGEYFGFEIDGNRRFVLGDFTVTHNTTMALALSAHLKVRTMIVVHKEFLADQWIEKIKEFCPGSTVGRIQGDTFDIEHDFVIAMIQTMCMREFPTDAFDSVGLLIVDEAHHIGAPAFSQFMFKICPKYTLGLTATPERKDGLTRLLYWFLGPEFYRVERAHQKSTRVCTLHYTDEAFKEAPPLTRFGKINMAGMITLLTELEGRNALIVRTVHEALLENRRVLVLTDRREHCHLLYHTLGTELSGLYIGGMKEEDLSASAAKRVVIATFQLAQEGLDIPVLDTVILSTPKSDIKQSIGRIMRETPGKLNDPLIYDVADQWSVFHSMYRKRCVVYREGGFGTGPNGEAVVPSGGEATGAAPFGAGKCLF